MFHKVDAADEKQLSSGCAEQDIKLLAGILMEMLFQKRCITFQAVESSGERHQRRTSEKYTLRRKNLFFGALFQLEGSLVILQTFFYRCWSHEG